jgi:hypothetical protein
LNPTGGQNGAYLVGSQRLNSQRKLTGPITAKDVQSLAGRLLSVSVEIHGAIMKALGPEAAVLDEKLNWEVLGREA